MRGGGGSQNQIPRWRSCHCVITLMQLVANLAKTKCYKKLWYMGTHIRVLSESYTINTKMAGLKWFSKKNVACFYFGQK